MSTPPIVQTRHLSLEELVRKAWGKEYTKPDIAYEFSGGRKFESTDGREGGPYDPNRED